MRTIDLFAGCGGLSKGFASADFTLIAAFELWEAAAKCYKANFPDHPLLNIDLSNIEAATGAIARFAPEIIIGGPPCQDFSHAGNRNEGDRANLTESFAQIVRVIRPRWFVMENVDRAYKSTAYSKARAVLSASGYGLTERVLNASFCGVPQSRKRFFCIGLLGAQDGFLVDDISKSLSERAMTVREFLGDELGLTYYYRHPRNYDRRGIFSIDEPAPTVRGVNRPVPQGYVGHPGDPIVLNDALRALTTAERARIQTFPSDYIWEGSKTDLEQMIGNAVPVKLAEFVGRVIKVYDDRLQSDKLEEDAWAMEESGLKDWLINEAGLKEQSAKDVVSRLRRAKKLINLDNAGDVDCLLFELGRKDEFKQLSQSVKSQIRRAIKLNVQYSSLGKR